jgi:hypothetical protein
MIIALVTHQVRYKSRDLVVIKFPVGLTIIMGNLFELNCKLTVLYMDIKD